MIRILPDLRSRGAVRVSRGSEHRNTLVVYQSEKCTASDSTTKHDEKSETTNIIAPTTLPVKRRSFVRSGGIFCLIAMSAGCSGVFNQSQTGISSNGENSAIVLRVTNYSDNLKKIHITVDKENGGEIVDKTIALLGGPEEETQIAAKINIQNRDIDMKTIIIERDGQLKEKFEYNPSQGNEDVDIRIYDSKTQINYD